MKKSFQLFSVRNFDLKDILPTVCDAQIFEVEGFAPNYDKAEEFAQSLTALSMRMSSGHFSWDMVQNSPDAVLDIAKIFGMDTIIVPYLPPETRPANFQEWQDFAKALSQAGEIFRGEGYQFAWHNHDFEFLADEAGNRPIDAIIEHAPHIALELDLAWVKMAGLDPVDMLKTYHERVHMIHIKDIAPKGENRDEDGWADLGMGIMDLQAIHAQCQNMNILRAVLEHDNPNDAQRFIKNSAQAFLKL